MWYRQLKNTDLHVSALCLGTVNYGTAMPAEQCFAQLNSFADSGGNFIDTAHVYGDWEPGPAGRSERIIGQWMRKNNVRKSMILSTKGAHPRLDTMSVSRMTPEDIRTDLRESLENLGTDTIDLYFLHRDDPDVPVGEIIDLLDELKADGSIRYYGCSNWTLNRLREAREYAAKKQSAGFVCNQVMWSLADVRKSAVGDPTMVLMDRETYDYHVQSSIAVMAYISIAKGYFSRRKASLPISRSLEARYGCKSNDAIYETLLRYVQNTGRSVTSLSFQYLMAHPFDSVPIASFSKPPQLQEAIDACAEKPDPATVHALHRMKAWIVND